MGGAEHLRLALHRGATELAHRRRRLLVHGQRAAQRVELLVGVRARARARDRDRDRDRVRVRARVRIRARARVRVRDRVRVTVSATWLQP